VKTHELFGWASARKKQDENPTKLLYKRLFLTINNIV